MKIAILTTIMGMLCFTASAQNTPWATTGNIGIGTTSPGAPLDILNTTENLRLSYDATNKASLKVSATGNLIMTPGAGGTSNTVQIVGSLVTGTTSSNLWIGSTTGATAASVTQFLYGGGAANYVRVGVYGSSTTSVATGRTTAGFMVANMPYTLAASASVPWISNVVIKPVGTITFGSGATLSKTASLYIADASTQGQKNFALFVNNGTNYFGGNVGIGIDNPTEKLEVNGTIHAREVKVNTTGWPDYVFKNNFRLMPLSLVSDYVNKYHHLPGVPSEKEIAENGLSLGEMNKILTKKVEELTLYLIRQ